MGVLRAAGVKTELKKTKSQVEQASSAVESNPDHLMHDEGSSQLQSRETGIPRKARAARK